MPETRAGIDKLRAGTPLRVNNITLLPIERIVMYADHYANSAWFTVSKAPAALLVHDAGGIRLASIDATSLTLDELRSALAGFDDILASI